MAENLPSVSSPLSRDFAQCFREKRYIPVDYNTLLMSICLTCISGDGFIQTDKTGPPYDIYLLLYNSVVLQFIRMVSKGFIRMVSKGLCFKFTQSVILLVNTVDNSNSVYVH